MPKTAKLSTTIFLLLCALACTARDAATPAAPTPAAPTPGGAAAPRPARQVILLVIDGLRADMVNASDMPNLDALGRRGVRLKRNHSVFPCTTLTNAGALATGSYAQKSGWWGEKLYVPHATGRDAKGDPIDFSQHVDARDWGTLKRLDEAHGGQLLTARTLFKTAKGAGLKTAVMGKAAATFLQDMDFPTYFLDTDTAAPASFARELAARGYALPALTAKAFPEIALPADHVNPYAAARPRLLEDGLTSDPSHPEAGPSQTAGYAYLLRQYLEFVLPVLRPDLTLLWINEPDATMHTYGPGSPQYRAAVREVDRWVAQIVAKVDELGLAASTDILLTADHGATTVSGPLSSFPLRRIDKADGAGGGTVAKPGAVDAASGWSVSGQAMLIELLRRGGFSAFNGRRCVFDPLMTGLKADGTPVFATQVDAAGAVCQGKKFTSVGFPVPPAGELPRDAVLVMETAGGDFIEIPSGDRALVERVVRFLQELPQVGAIFVNSKLGPIPGTLALRDILLETPTGARTPTLAIDFWSDPHASIQGVRGIGYHNKPSPAGLRGDHGALAPQDIDIPGLAIGPDFREGFANELPTANVDFAPTIAHLLGLDPAFIAGADGRVLFEALKPGGHTRGRPESDYVAARAVVRPPAAATGLAVRSPTSPDGAERGPAAGSYTMELHVSTVSLDAKVYRYIDSATAIRN
jgi:arylsulfatase A-like enzyme